MNQLRRTHWLPLIFLVGVILAAGCTRGPETASPAVTPAQQPEVTLSAPEATDPPGTPSATTTAADSSTSSIRVISSSSMSLPSSVEPPGFGGVNPMFSPQSAGLPGGLTVSVRGSVEVEADEAYVVILPGARYGPTGPQPISSRDRADVLERLAALGIEMDDIEFESQERYGPPSVSVEVAANDLPEIGESVLRAVEDVLGRSEHHGVRFSLSADNCDEALALARREAIPQAHRTADDLAGALGVGRGIIIGAMEYPLMGFSYGPISVDTCGGQFQDPFLLSQFDAEATVKVSVGLQVTYVIEP